LKGSVSDVEAADQEEGEATARVKGVQDLALLGVWLLQGVPCRSATSSCLTLRYGLL
jgi:hypothetical protein